MPGIGNDTVTGAGEILLKYGGLAGAFCIFLIIAVALLWRQLLIAYKESATKSLDHMEDLRKFAKEGEANRTTLAMTSAAVTENTQTVRTMIEVFRDRSHP